MRSTSRAPWAIALTALALALLAAPGCATVRVASDYDPAWDFSGYRRYAWLPGARRAPTGLASLDAPQVHQRIRAGIDAELAHKGFAEVAEGPDFFVNYLVTAEERFDVRREDDAALYGPGGLGRDVPVTRVHEYHEGTLVIDVFDAREQKRVWRGIGQGRLREAPRADPEQAAERTREAIREVLAGFPPPR